MGFNNRSKGVVTDSARSFFAHTLSLLSLYWKGEEKVFAWAGLVALMVLSLLSVATALAINEWYKHFYNAVQALDESGFID